MWSVLWKSAAAAAQCFSSTKSCKRAGPLWSVRLSATGTSSAPIATGNHLLASSKTKVSIDCFITTAWANHSPGNKPRCKPDYWGVAPSLQINHKPKDGERADRSAAAAAAPLTTGHLSACTAALSPLQLSAQCERLRCPQTNQRWWKKKMQWLTFSKFVFNMSANNLWGCQ